MLIRCLSKSLNEKLGKLETVVKNAGSNSLYKDLKIDVVNNRKCQGMCYRAIGGRG